MKVQSPYKLPSSPTDIIQWAKKQIVVHIQSSSFSIAQSFMKLPNCYYTDPFLWFKGSKYFFIHKHISSCHAVAMGTIQITTSLSNFVGHHEVHQIIHLMWSPIIPHLATGIQLKISNCRNIIPPHLWGKKKHL